MHNILKYILQGEPHLFKQLLQSFQHSFDLNTAFNSVNPGRGKPQNDIGWEIRSLESLRMAWDLAPIITETR